MAIAAHFWGGESPSWWAHLLAVRVVARQEARKMLRTQEAVLMGQAEVKPASRVQWRQGYKPFASWWGE